jgi:hypothetical protein
MTVPKPPSQSGCEWVEECIELCNATSIHVDERGVAATFLNPRRKQIRKIHYDACYNTEPGSLKADYILGIQGVVDIVIELKGSHTNLKHASEQVASTLDVWQRNPNRWGRLAALVVYGAVRTRDDLPRRRPKAFSSVQSVENDFRSRFKDRILLFIHESGEKKFRFSDFLRKNDAS